jgi:hypothetical protein
MGLKSLGKKAEECQGRRVIESGDRLHTFSPKTGGQTEFYELVMESTRSGKFPRAVDLIGGIGCISGDTLINGVPAKELQNSPNTVETLIGELTSSPVYLKGQANLYRVTTRRGKRIVVTGMHRFLTQKGFYPLQSLRCGDFVAIRDTENDCHDWGKPKGYQSRYCEDFHHDDAIPHPFSVFVLDRLQQFFLHHNDIPD